MPRLPARDRVAASSRASGSGARGDSSPPATAGRAGRIRSGRGSGSESGVAGARLPAARSADPRSQFAGSEAAAQPGSRKGRTATARTPRQKPARSLDRSHLYPLRRVPRPPRTLRDRQVCARPFGHHRPHDSDRDGDPPARPRRPRRGAARRSRGTLKMGANLCFPRPIGRADSWPKKLRLKGPESAKEPCFTTGSGPPLGRLCPTPIPGPTSPK